MKRRKNYRKTYSKNRKTFDRGKKILYVRNGCIYLESGFPTGALISAVISIVTCSNMLEMNKII